MVLREAHRVKRVGQVTNLPLGFGMLAAGGVLVVAGITGSPLTDVLAGRAHLKASGGAPGGSGSPGATATSSGGRDSKHADALGLSGYVNPFGDSLASGGRIDEGVDPTIQGPIAAIGNAKIVNLSYNFYKNEPYLVYQLLDGVHKGKYVYVSELITPQVKQGDTVKAGQTIAWGHGAIETGWAGGSSGSYLPLANKAQGGPYTEGMVTTAGQSFVAFLKSLGVKGGGFG